MWRFDLAIIGAISIKNIHFVSTLYRYAKMHMKREQVTCLLMCHVFFKVGLKWRVNFVCSLRSRTLPTNSLKCIVTPCLYHPYHLFISLFWQMLHLIVTVFRQLALLVKAQLDT